MTTIPHARPLLSIGLPVYNGMPYLEHTLNSLAAEPLDDIEFVVCDNASTDDSWELISDIAAGDPRFLCFRNERNVGASRNYNKVFQLARGTFFRWCASDDYTSAQALSRCIEALTEDPELFLAFPETRLIDGKDQIIGEHDDGDGWSAESPADRFAFSLTQWGYCNVVFGVMRADILRQSMLLADYPASDLVLQADLAVRGRFRRIAGDYYYRRVHDNCTDALDAHALAQFYEPQRKTVFTGKHLRMFRDLWTIVWQASVSAADKRKMASTLGRQMYWYRSALAAEAAILMHLPRKAG